MISFVSINDKPATGTGRIIMQFERGSVGSDRGYEKLETFLMKAFRSAGSNQPEIIQSFSGLMPISLQVCLRLQLFPRHVNQMISPDRLAFVADSRLAICWRTLVYGYETH